MRRGRRAKGFTQEELAQKLGIERKTYSTYETGRSKPDHDILGLMMHVLSIEKEVIHYFSEQKVPHETTVNESEASLGIKGVKLIETHADVKKYSSTQKHSAFPTKEERIFDELSMIRQSNDRLITQQDKLIDQQGVLVETNRKLADKLISIDSSGEHENAREQILETLVTLIAKIGVDAGTWKDEATAIVEAGKMLSGKLEAKTQGGNLGS